MNVKKGLDFFLLDVSLDEKLELIEAEFGLTGFAVIVKLWQRIYGGQGYYCEYTDEVALLFSKSINEGVSVVSEIVSASLRRGIFDRQMYDKYHILTSAGIQKRYFEAVKRRKDLKVEERYLLIPYTQNFENVDISSENVDSLPENVDSLRQRREENKREDKKIVERESNAPARTKLKQYGQYKNVLLSDEDYAKLTDALKEKDRDEYIKRLDVHIEVTGKRYKNHYATICKWYEEDHRKAKKGSFDTDEFWEAAWKKSYGDSFCYEGE